MKKCLLMFLFVSISINAQIVNIPDANFKAVLLDASPSNGIARDLSGSAIAIDINNDGEIQVSEAFTVVDLSMTNRSISSLIGIEEFTNLEFLTVSYNNIADLDISQNLQLDTLYAQDNQLSNLDVSQNLELEYLLVDRNEITNINLSHNSNLQEINFRDNQLTSIDVSQNLMLSDINVSVNNLQSINVSNNINLTNLVLTNTGLLNINLTQNINLTSLFIEFNQLTSLDLSQNQSLGHLSCQNNNLNSLIIKNGSSGNLFLDNNPNLTYICLDEEEINQVLNLVSSNVVLSPYCSFAPGGNYNTIEGYVFYDPDNNGCNVGNIPIPNARVEINDGSQTGVTFTNFLGKYSFLTDTGSFTVSAKPEISSCYENNNQSYNASFPNNDNNLYAEDFCITPVENCDDVEVHIFPMNEPSPGFDTTYGIIYKNKGSDIASGDIEFIYDNTILDYVSSSIPFDNQIIGSLFWDYSNLLPFETRTFTVTLNLNTPTEDPAVNIGEELDFEAVIQPIPGDYTPEDNVSTLKQIVVGSFDPNDITCLEGDIVSSEMVGEYLHYNIRFENTGTAAATFIVVRDDIDVTKFDLNTLRVMYASHEMMTRITDNKVEFIFENINLAPEGRGNVVFKIKTEDSLTIGDSVENKADIFFDYNFPIETNTATTTFQTLSVDDFGLENSVSVYPNPTNGKLFINSTYSIEDLILYDIQGRKVRSFIISEANTMDISNMSKGVYFLEIISTKGKSTKKIIKD